MNKSVYLAGPIRHDENDGATWRNQIKQRKELQWVDPLDSYNDHSDEYGNWSSQRIVENDLALIDKSDALLVNWDGTLSVGTPMEVVYAYLGNKEICVVTDVDDISPWFEYHGTIFDSFDEATHSLVCD